MYKITVNNCQSEFGFNILKEYRQSIGLQPLKLVFELAKMVLKIVRNVSLLNMLICQELLLFL